MKYSVILVDDEALVLSRLSLGFEWEDTDFAVIASFTDSREALKQIIHLKPDVVFTDIKMPHMTGLELMKKAKMHSRHTRFVFISGYEDFDYVHTALSLGASGYCVKPLDDEEIYQTLIKVKQELGKQRQYQEALLGNFLDRASLEQLESLIIELREQYDLVLPFYIGASIGDIHALLEGYVPFVQLQYGSNEFFYFMPEDTFLKNAGFKQRLVRLMQNGEVISFSYVRLKNVQSGYDCIRALLEQLYGYFLRDEKLVQGDFAVSGEMPASSGQYMRMLEQYYSEHKKEDFVDCLTRYQQEYPPSQRSMEEAVRIYNLAMALVLQAENSYFDALLRTPDELIARFERFGDMMEFLKRALREKLSGTRNLDMIKNDTVRSVLEYLHLNFRQQISFQEICRQFSISPSYLSQMFQKELGMTFTAYLTGLRIEYAKKMLETTNMPISQVGEQSGYDQCYYFSRIFKKCTEVSPSEYREICHSMGDSHDEKN